MTSFGFCISIILLLLKVFGIGALATASWWIVVLPFLIALLIDILLFAVFGFTIFKVFDRL